MLLVHATDGTYPVQVLLDILAPADLGQESCVDLGWLRWHDLLQGLLLAGLG